MENVKLGSLYILLAAVAYACMGVLVKAAGPGIPDVQLVFMRNLICLLVLCPPLFIPKPKSLKTDVFKVHLIRAIAGLLNMYCFFYSIRYILLADAMLLNNTMPLFIPLVMWIWKRSKIPLPLIPGLIAGFVGVILILHPDRALFHPAAFLALASGLFMSISMVGIRELSRHEPIYRIMFYYFSISTVLSFIPIFWSWEKPTLILWGILIGVGLFAAGYQFFLTKGYEKASAAKISPLIYFAVILSGIFDWIFWRQKPDLLSLLGVVLVVIGAGICVRTGASR